MTVHFEGFTPEEEARVRAVAERIPRPAEDVVIYCDVTFDPFTWGRATADDIYLNRDLFDLPDGCAEFAAAHELFHHEADHTGHLLMATYQVLVGRLSAADLAAIRDRQDLAVSDWIEESFPEYTRAWLAHFPDDPRFRPAWRAETELAFEAVLQKEAQYGK